VAVADLLQLWTDAQGAAGGWRQRPELRPDGHQSKVYIKVI